MLRVLRNQIYRRLFTAQTWRCSVRDSPRSRWACSPTTSRADMRVSLGGIFTVKMIAYVFVAPLTSAALIRLPRRTVMVASDLLRLVVALCLPFADQVGQIFVLVFVLQAASATFTPTFQAVIPLVLPDEDDYTQALSLSRLAYDLESIVSPMLAALLLLVVHSNALFFGTALGFAASAMLVLSTALPVSPGLTSADDGPQLPFGIRASRRHAFRPPARPAAILALNFVAAAAMSLVLVQTVVIVRSQLGLDGSMVAVFLAINGAGSMTAALAIPRVLRTVDERTIMLPAAGILATLTALAESRPADLGGPTQFGMLAVLWFVMGWPGQPWRLIGRIVRRETPSDQLSAAFAAQSLSRMPAG